MKSKILTRTLRVASMVSAGVLAVTLAACATPQAAEEPGENGSEEPIRVGGTLALTGPLAATGLIHKVTGELYVDWLNENGGLLGRPVEWVLLDDESNPQTAAAAYNRLITQDNVDLVVGPYGTAGITAAMEVAERYNMVFPHHSATLTYAYDYEKHFPLFASGRHSSETVSATIFDAYEQLDDAPQSVAFVVNENPATMFIAHGNEQAGETGSLQAAEERGLDVVLDVTFPQGAADWGPIAQRIKDADPDLLWVGALGGDTPELLTALAQVNWQPRHQFHLFPAPGLALSAGEASEGLTTTTLFEPFDPYLSNTGADVLVERFPAAAKEAGIVYTVPELQAGASWAMWQLLAAGVEGAGSLDQDAIAEYLLNNSVETVIGTISPDPEQNNYYGDYIRLKQIQDGSFWVVHPEEYASEGRSLR